MADSPPAHNVGPRIVVRSRGGCLSSSVQSIAVAVALAPDLWARLFTSDEAVLAAARQYLRWAGPGFALFGLGLCLYFASQGAGRILGPVLAATVRLVLVLAVGGALAAAGAPLWTLFALVAAAMVTYGVLTAAAVWLTPWGKP